MKKISMPIPSVVAIVSLASASLAQGYKMPDHPTVIVDGQPWSPLTIVSINMGTAAEQEEQFPPHRIIGNIYYVGTKTLSSFLVVTSKGNILIDTTYERNVKTIEKSVEQLGFKFSDIKIILGNHAHGDHMEGDSLAKKDSGGALVEAMAEDVPALMAMKPGGKEHPVDVVLHNGDAVTLGDTTLMAYLTAGHTHGCTTFTTTAYEAGKRYDVVFGCSLRSPNAITPPVAAEFGRSFEVVRSLPCDVWLGDHGREFGMQAKYAKLKAGAPNGAPNPYIDKRSCTWEIDLEEAMFKAVMQEQEDAAAAVKAATPKP